MAIRDVRCWTRISKELGSNHKGGGRSMWRDRELSVNSTGWSLMADCLDPSCQMAVAVVSRALDLPLLHLNRPLLTHSVAWLCCRSQRVVWMLLVWTRPWMTRKLVMSCGDRPLGGYKAVLNPGCGSYPLLEAPLPWETADLMRAPGWTSVMAPSVKHEMRSI